MIILTHIVIALASLVCASYAFFRPSKKVIRASYALISATFASGTYLIVSTRTHLLESCVMGLAFIGSTLVATVVAERKLAYEKSRVK